MKYVQIRPCDVKAQVIIAGKPLKNWQGWCMAVSRSLFNINPKYDPAWLGWESTKHKHLDMVWPKDVYFLIWFRHWGTYDGETGNFGHVVVARHSGGKLELWSSPRTSKAAVDYYTSLKEVERIYNSQFVGWSEDINDIRVIKADTGMDELTTRRAVEAEYLSHTGKIPTQDIVDQKVAYCMEHHGFGQFFDDIHADEQGSNGPSDGVYELRKVGKVQ